MTQTTDKSSEQLGRMELVYCPMCTHTVQGVVISKGKRLVVAPGQVCSRCHSALDDGYVIRRDLAA